MRPSSARTHVDFKDQIERGPDWLQKWKAENPRASYMSDEDFDRIARDELADSPLLVSKDVAGGKSASDKKNWRVIASGGSLSPNPDAPSYPTDQIGDRYEKLLYTPDPKVGGNPFPVYRTPDGGIYSLPATANEATVATEAAQGPLPDIEPGTRYSGGVTRSYNHAWSQAMNSNNSVVDRIIYGAGALAMMPDMAVESLLYAPFNVNGAASEAGQYLARANLQSDPAMRNLDYLHLIATSAEGFGSAGAWVGGGRPQPSTRTNAATPVSTPSPTAARQVSSRHVSWGSSLSQVSGSLERLGQRALQRSGGDAQRAERLFEQYSNGVKNRLMQTGSEFGIEVQPAALKDGTHVPGSIWMHRGGGNSPLVPGLDNLPKPYAWKGSRRLDLGVVDTSVGTPNQHGMFPVVAGFDITLDATKRNIVPYYQEYFGNIPIYDIRLPQ